MRLPSTSPAEYWARTTHLLTSSGSIGWIERRTLTFWLRTDSASIGDGRLHRGQGHKLHDVVLHHVADGARLVVIAAAAADAEAFGDGDLDVVDIIAVPDRLEDAVAKAEDQDVLHRLFAEVVVDAVDLLLLEDALQLVVELLGAGKVLAEGLFDDEAGPAAICGAERPTSLSSSAMGAKTLGGVAR